MNTKKIEKLLIFFDLRVRDALEAIEANKKRFLVCINEKKQVMGSIVDGDIRRGLLKNPDINQRLNLILNKNISCVNTNAGFSEICTIFKDEKIDFIPIVDDTRIVINIITKRQFHILMLNDIDYCPRLDFSVYDDKTIEHEIHNRPWGFYKSTLLSSYAQSKVLTVFPKSQLSLQEIE